MNTTQTQRTRVQLADYECAQDISDRLLITNLTPVEVDILEEVLHSSISFVVTNLEKLFPPSKVHTALSKLETAKLLKIEGDMVHLNKERRKSFELLIERFEEEFRPNLDYVQHLLRKAPIHCLPMWYTIPRACDDIFTAIIEQYFATPRLYQRHLQEWLEEQTEMAGIVRDLCEAPYCVPASVLKDRYNLDETQYQEAVLVLEFGLAACSGFKLDNGVWVEVLMPLHEYSSYLKERSKRFARLKGPSEPQPPEAFPFLRNMREVLQKLPSKSSTVDHRTCGLMKRLGLTSEEEGILTTTERGTDWLNLPLEQWSQRLCHYQRSRYQSRGADSCAYTERDLMAVGKAMQHIPTDAWVPARDFHHTLEVGIGSTEGIRLVRCGRGWAYSWPDYSPEDREWLCAIVCRRCKELGLLDLETIDGELHLRLSAYGTSQLQTVD